MFVDFGDISYWMYDRLKNGATSRDEKNEKEIEIMLSLSLEQIEIVNVHSWNYSSGDYEFQPFLV